MADAGGVQTNAGPVTYRLARKNNLWAEFTPQEHGLTESWQMQVTARGRGGGKTLAVLLETTPLRPLVSLTLRGEAFPLPIHWHDLKRGGVLCFGGERRLGRDGATLLWEMRWTPQDAEAGLYLVETRLRATPRREGSVTLTLNVPLYRPDVWSVEPARRMGHCAETAWSNYNRHAVAFALMEGEEAGWSAADGDYVATLRNFPLGGGKILRFSVQFLHSDDPRETHAPLVHQFAALAGTRLHPLGRVPSLDPTPAVDWLLDPENQQTVGAERIYLKPPFPAAEGTFYAGHPHYPLDALQALADWQKFRPTDAGARLARFGAMGMAADFPVLGRGDLPEPNRGVFWDRRTSDGFSDYAGGMTHGLAANARIARALFLLHQSTGETLLRQAALNICQWLILKFNEDGYYDGERVHATEGRPTDGKFLPRPNSLDGVEGIRPLVLAFRATGNEVFVKAAWKIAQYLLDHRIPNFDSGSPVAVARVVCGLAALNAEAPNSRLEAAMQHWGAWMRALPLDPTLPELNPDGLYGGLYDCAHAGFLLHALTRETSLLRYAFSALALIPADARARSARSLAIWPTAFLSLACLIPDAAPDFDAVRLTFGWRVFTPDPANAQYLHVTAADGDPVDHFPLVCRANDQLLILAVGPPEVDAVTILKNNRRPVVRDLLTDVLDTHAELHPLAGEGWANVGLFTVDP